MAYYLRQDKKKKGTYLQMYESYWDKEKKQPRSRNIENFGYVSDLISDEIPDPVSYYQKYVEKKNREHADSVADKTRPRASTVFPRLYHGVPFSEDQVYDGCAFIGESYKKYIELFNHCYEDHYKRDFSSTFFDCTNYYFEIDLPKEDKTKTLMKRSKN